MLHTTTKPTTRSSMVKFILGMTKIWEQNVNFKFLWFFHPLGCHMGKQADTFQMPMLVITEFNCTLTRRVSNEQGSFKKSQGEGKQVISRFGKQIHYYKVCMMKYVTPCLTWGNKHRRNQSEYAIVTTFYLLRWIPREKGMPYYENSLMHSCEIAYRTWKLVHFLSFQVHFHWACWEASQQQPWYRLLQQIVTFEKIWEKNCCHKMQYKNMPLHKNRWKMSLGCQTQLRPYTTKYHSCRTVQRA